MTIRHGPVPLGRIRRTLPGQGAGAETARLAGEGVVSGDDGGGEGLEVGYDLGIGELAVLEVAGLEVDSGGSKDCAEPAEYGAELGVHGEVVVIGTTHSDEAADLAVEGFDGEVVKEVLEGAGVGGAEDGGGDEKHIRRGNLFHQFSGVVREVSRGTAISERDGVVPEVEESGGNTGIGWSDDVEGQLEGPMKASRGRDRAVDSE